MIREAEIGDLENLLQLYTFLNVNPFPNIDMHLHYTWGKMLNNEYQHIIVAEEDGILISTCTLTVIPNITHGIRNYAFIENVVTHRDYRNKGYASQVLAYARDIAVKEDCYKIMLMTGHPDIIGFYEKNGYNSEDKHGLVLWLGRKD